MVFFEHSKTINVDCFAASLSQVIYCVGLSSLYKHTASLCRLVSNPPETFSVGPVGTFQELEQPLFFVRTSRENRKAFVTHFYFYAQYFQIVVFWSVVGEDEQDSGIVTFRKPSKPL